MAMENPKGGSGRVGEDNNRSHYQSSPKTPPHVVLGRWKLDNSTRTAHVLDSLGRRNRKRFVYK